MMWLHCCSNKSSSKARIWLVLCFANNYHLWSYMIINTWTQTVQLQLCGTVTHCNTEYWSILKLRCPPISHSRRNCHWQLLASIPSWRLPYKALDLMQWVQWMRRETWAVIRWFIRIHKVFLETRLQKRYPLLCFSAWSLTYIGRYDIDCRPLCRGTNIVP